MDIARKLVQELGESTKSMEDMDTSTFLAKAKGEAEQAVKTLQEKLESKASKLGELKKDYEKRQSEIRDLNQEVAQLEKARLEAREWEPHLKATIQRLESFLQSWAPSHAQLKGAVAAHEAAKAAFGDKKAVFDKDMLPEIERLEKDLSKLKTAVFPAASIPQWQQSDRLTCASDSKPVASAPYCLIAPFSKNVLVLLSRRERGWAALSQEERKQYPEWPTEIILLDNLHTALSALIGSNERWISLGKGLENARVEALR